MTGGGEARRPNPSVGGRSLPIRNERLAGSCRTEQPGIRVLVRRGRLTHLPQQPQQLHLLPAHAPQFIGTVTWNDGPSGHVACPHVVAQ